MSKSVRVGFVYPGGGTEWMGGANYLRNLLAAIRSLPERRIETVLLAPHGANADEVAGFGADAVVRTSAVEARHPMRIAGKLAERLTGRNIVLERVLARHRIDVLSHSLPQGERSRFPVISWIPDFQERHLPDFFSPDEMKRRAAGHDRVVAGATLIVLSSAHALGDLLSIYPQAKPRARILRFASPVTSTEATTAPELAERYGLRGRYFHVPNQFWIHKNHRVVLDALAILRQQGVEAHVISTGHTGDYRHPDFFDSLMAHAQAAGVSDMFQVAGLVPYADMLGLMRDSVAVLNPSLFEGWSTTVEEARSRGKQLILSDIPVHREQAPARGAYFPPHEPAALAMCMREALESYSPRTDQAAAAAAKAEAPARFSEFAKVYEEIALEAAGVATSAQAGMVHR